MPVVSLPAPYGGQNNKDGIYNLSPEFASSLVNWIPGPGYLDARGPCIAYSSGTVGAPIQAIWGHPSGTGVFATDVGELYEVLPVIGSALDATPTSGDFHGNVFQDRLILCNGVDTPRIYNGTAVSTGTYTGITTPADLYGSLTFKGRVYYWEQGARRFWYAAAGAFQGALSSFDLATFTRGDGTLVSIAPMTFDGGQGPDDLIAFLFSNGEVLVYQGDDPGNANAWQQVGAFRIGKMVGRACWAVVGSSTLVATDLGVVDLARALSTGAMDDSAVIGQQFGAQNMIFGSSAITDRQLIFDPGNRILWLALFDQTAIGSAQNMLALHGMDTESRAWFTTSQIAYGAGGIGSASAFGLVGGVVRMGASSTGRLITAPQRTNDLAANDFFNAGAITYTSAQYFTLDSPNRNKQGQAIAVQMQRTSSVDPEPSLTFAIGSELSPGVSTAYLPSVTVRAFNSTVSYGTRLIFGTTLVSKSGIRWYNTDLMVKPGREV